jgi:hypothetical protein
MVNHSPYECSECLDGLIFPRGECPQCGSRFRRKGRLNREERKGWEGEAKSRISSSEFQEMVALARKSLSIPENGLPAAEMNTFLWGVHFGAWCNYCWSLETFQRRMLSIEGERARAEYLRPALGELAEVVAQYSMPIQPRPQAVDWLLCAKLIAARLCSFVGIDNVRDMLLYILCPGSRNPESWRMRRIKLGQDPFRRQFGRFLQALLPLGEEEVSRRPFKGYVDAAAQATFDLLQRKATWEQCRRAYARAFPFYIPESTEALRVRAKRPAQKLPYDQILNVARSFFVR